MPDVRKYTQEQLRKKLNWNDLDPEYLRQLIGLAKIEDLAGAGLAERPEQLGDVTTALLPEGSNGAAQLVAREPIIICGLGLVQPVLDAYGEAGHFEAHMDDGARVATGQCIGLLTGPSKILLQAERIILNFLQHLSGIATETRKYVEALGQSDTCLLDTRKTLPGYRVLQKYAFSCGGGYNHRIGLFDRVMLKDNHIAANKIDDEKLFTETIHLARSTCPTLPIEVEVDTLEQIQPVLDAGADIILLDNFSPDNLKTAIEMIGDDACTEASGGIQIEDLPALGKLGLDFISTGAPVHQSAWKDIGLDWQ